MHALVQGLAVVLRRGGAQQHLERDLPFFFCRSRLRSAATRAQSIRTPRCAAPLSGRRRWLVLPNRGQSDPNRGDVQRRAWTGRDSLDFAGDAATLAQHCRQAVLDRNRTHQLVGTSLARLPGSEAV